MKIYWGGLDSGKGHVVKYARLHNKTFIQWKKYQIIKRHTKCLNYGYDIHERLWWDIEDNWEVFHKRKDENNVRVSEFKTGELCPLFMMRNFSNYSNPDWGQESEIKWEGSRKLFKKEDYVKYMQRQYIDSNVYNFMIRTNKVEDTLDNINIDKTLLPFGRIVYGVDLMFMFQFTDGNFDEEIIYWSDFLKRQTNILPYKEDLLDSITTKFDKVGHLSGELWGCDLMHEYKNNKERLWKYMDDFFEHEKRIENIMKSNNIPYIKFNLDRDSYEDIFGWGENIMDNTQSHPYYAILTEPDHYLRWEEVKTISKEYMYERGL